jgi:hypothetical protein
MDTVRVGQVQLADATSTIALPAGPRVELPASGVAPALPAGAKVVQIAADREAPYGAVRALVQAVHAAGAEPVLLVSREGKMAALPPLEEASAVSILIELEDRGKTCVSPPAAEQRLCLQPPYKPKVERASVPGLVRDAVKGYHLEQVHLRPSAALSWVEVVRGIDGARTCCAGVKMRVSVEDLPAR